VNTDIEYLKLLERDLEDVAVREVSRSARPAATPAPRRRSGNTWARVAGVAAAFLVVAGAIGFIAGGGGDASSPAQFDQVGSAVNGAGGADGQDIRGVGRTPTAVAPEDGLPYAAPAPSPAPSGAGSGVTTDAGKNLFDAGPRPGQLQDLSKIIRDGKVSVVVPDGTFQDNEDAVTSIAESYGGFVLSSSTQGERSGTFVLRIPAKRFDSALGEIRALGTVRSQQVTGNDVTAEFIDVQARLEILEGQRDLLLGLRQDATTTDEILRLSSQLNAVQLRIEQMQGQIRFINDQVAEATLRVTITERSAPHTEPAEDIENPNLGSSVDLAVQGFLRIVGAVIVGLGYLIPLTILAGLIWVVATAVRRRRAV
jgi:Domain of unknown function (DUF4349)